MNHPSSGRQDSIGRHLSSSRASSIPAAAITAPSSISASSSSQLLPLQTSSSSPSSDFKVKAEGSQPVRPIMTARKGGFSVGSTIGRSALGTRYRKSYDNPLRDGSDSTNAVPYFEILDSSSSDEGDDLLSSFLGASSSSSRNRTGDGELKESTNRKPISLSGSAAARADRPVNGSDTSPKCHVDGTSRSFLDLGDIDSEVEQISSASKKDSAAKQLVIKQENSSVGGVPVNSHNNTSQNAISYDSEDDGSSSDPLTGDIPAYASTPRRQSLQFPKPKSAHKSPGKVRNHTVATPATSYAQATAAATFRSPQTQSSTMPLGTPAKGQSKPSSTKPATPSQTVLPQRLHPSGSTSRTKPRSVATPRQNGMGSQLNTAALQSPLPHRTKPIKPPSTAAKTTAKVPTKQQSTSSKTTTMSTPSVLPTAHSIAPTGSSSRRPRRNVAQPVNYFAPRPGYHGYVDEEGNYQEDLFVGQPAEEAAPTSPPPARTRKAPPEVLRPVLPPNKVAPKRPVYPILYQSATIHARQEPLNYESAQAYLKLTRTKGLRRPYVGYQMRVKINQLCSSLNASKMKRSEGEIIHCDFEYDEVKAVYSIMIEKDDLPSDVQEPASLLQHLRQRLKLEYSSDIKLEELARRLSTLNSLRKSLTKAKTSLVECRNSFMDGSLGAAARKMIIESLQHLGLIGMHINPNVGLQDLLGAATISSFDRICFLYPLTKGLKYRNKMALLKTFLLDARDNTLSRVPSLIRALPNPNFNTDARRIHYCDDSVPSLLRRREIGYTAGPVQRPRQQFGQEPKPWKSWKGASNDITQVGWSPDGTQFIVGASAHCDRYNMQYNRDRNLLLGDVATSRLRELPDHRIPRPANSQHFLASDYCYMTISQALWRGDQIYTSSFDNTVKVWDASDFGNTRCVRTLNHNARVDAMDVSSFGAIATATSLKKASFNLWFEGSDSKPFTLPLHKGSAPHTDIDMIASSLRWGNDSAANYLVGGLSGKESDKSFDPPRDGRLLLWRLRDDGPVLEFVKNMNVFDVKWHPDSSAFAVGSGLNQSDNGVGRDTRSVIRIYEGLDMFRPVTEYLCPALDINEVNFCPTDRHYVSASCTDGITYVFDHRNPSAPVHTLRHAEPISGQWTGYDMGATREQGDVGVTFASWKATDEFYTGSTDGVVKRWDILKAPEDVLIEDVLSLNVEISCGEFSSDYSNLLLGDTTGGIHVFSSAPISGLDEEEESSHAFTFEAADCNQRREDSEQSGVSIARDSLASGELIRNPIIGVVQGPAYGQGQYTRNLFASWARPKNTNPQAMLDTPLLPDVQARQLLCPDYAKLSPADRDVVDEQIHMGVYRNRSSGDKKRKLSESSSGDGLLLPHGLPVIVLSDDSEEDDQESSPIEARNMLEMFLGSQVKKPRQLSHSDSGEVAVQDLNLNLNLNNVAPVSEDQNDDNGGGESSLLEDLEEDFWWPQLDISTILLKDDE